MKSIKVLSTKQLSSEQQQKLDDAMFDLEMYDAISIKQLPYENSDEVENAIITSQNAAQSIIDGNTQIKQVFCVGQKTASLLKSQNYNVVRIAENALVLAKCIVKNYKNDDFTFFCGNIRRDELPNVLTENSISFNEQVVYETSLKSQKFNKSFDAVLFFSPSAVQSYVQDNSLTNSLAFCIGNTTAEEAKLHCSEVVVATSPTIEDAITALVEHFKS
ncbi:MAG: uroporphyrinogen-III synthase [Flavobacteriaceae bacterium]